MIPAAMASSENVAAGARAVFFSVAYPDPKDGFSTRDAAGVFTQLDALFRAARAVTDPQWLAASAERLGQQGGGEAAPDHAIEPPAPKPAQEPAVRRIHMDWRHIEVATELPWEFIVGGGLVGLITMAKAVATEEPRVQVAIASLSLEQADWETRRTDAERRIIEVLGEHVLGR